MFLMMDHIFMAKLFVGLAIGLFFLFRIPFQLRCRKTAVDDRKLSEYQDIPLTIAKIGLLMPILWVITTRLEFANYFPFTGSLIAGLVFFLPALWLIHRSHADLGTNWSITLETQENHHLITNGVYQYVRHPMYLSMLLFSIGLVFSVSNYVAGPSMLISMIALLVYRVDSEEQMMVDRFGEEYERYQQRSSRLIPGVW